MLWVEAPAGVGFSYSNDTKDYDTNDNKTAADNYRFLQNFLQAYPQYQGRELWIAGESYAGVYLPTLAENILSNATSPLFKQFAGIMAGNPVFNCKTELENGMAIQFNLLYWHGLVSFRHFTNWHANNCDSKKQLPGLKCLSIFNEAVGEVGVIWQQLEKRDDDTNAQIVDVVRTASLDPDDLYQDFCTGNGTLQYSLDDAATCQDTNGGSLLGRYLNRKVVQEAIGARRTYWQICTSKINYHASGDSMVPYYEKFFVQKPGLSILVYSGDVDIMTVPFAVTQPCLAELNRPAMTEWGPWYVNGWTAGYTQRFDTFTYATLKGSGHEAPGYQPLNALAMFSRFLTKQNLTESDSVSNNSNNNDGEDKDRRRRFRVAFKRMLQHTRPLTQGMMLRRQQPQQRPFM